MKLFSLLRCLFAVLGCYMLCFMRLLTIASKASRANIYFFFIFFLNKNEIDVKILRMGD